MNPSSSYGREFTQLSWDHEFESWWCHNHQWFNTIQKKNKKTINDTVVRMGRRTFLDPTELNIKQPQTCMCSCTLAPPSKHFELCHRINGSSVTDKTEPTNKSSNKPTYQKSINKQASQETNECTNIQPTKSTNKPTTKPQISQQPTNWPKNYPTNQTINRHGIVHLQPF